MTYIPIDIGESIRREGLRRRFSPRTIESYQTCVRKFLYRTGKTIDVVSKKDIKEYLSALAEKDYAGSTLNVNLQALKFFFCGIMNKKMKLYLKYSKESKKLPVVLSKEEVMKLLNAIINAKHKFMISFMYSTGVRVSELVNMHAGDLELERNFGWVRNGKGGKDRMFIISEKLKERLKELCEGREPSEYLFVTNKNDKYDAQSIYMIIKNASKASGISKYKNVHPHTLRHSFATHLIENGYTISDVQHLLGHSSPETSTVYIHTAANSMINIKSPLDEL